MLGDERSCVACSTEAVFSGQRFFTCPVHRYCKMQRRASSARLEGLEADFAGHGRGVHEQRMFSDLSVTSARLSCVECWLLRGVETPPQTSYCSRKSRDFTPSMRTMRAAPRCWGAVRNPPVARSSSGGGGATPSSLEGYLQVGHRGARWALAHEAG